MSKLYVLLIILFMVSCISSPGMFPLEKAPRGSTFSIDGLYRLGVNDVVEIKVAGQEDFNGQHIISQSGSLNLPLIGLVTAKGMTEKKLFETLQRRLIPYIKNPVISLSIIKYESYKVFISGTVKTPGVFIFKEPTTILQAIATAGGLSNLSNGEIILHRRQKNGKIGKYTAEYDGILKGEKELNGFILERGDVLYVQ